jgi:hypothetical protein
MRHGSSRSVGVTFAISRAILDLPESVNFRER